MAPTRRDAAGRAAILLGHFGASYKVGQLTERDQRDYSSKRLSGGIEYRERSGKLKRTRPVRPRSVEADLVLLHAMLDWATTQRLPNGARLLPENPLEGIHRPRELNPVRPVATWERFQLTRIALRELRNDAKSDGERTRWTKIELALVLAEATGRRLGSIRQLRWEDIDFERGEIRWRAATDKKRREWVVPAPSDLVEELRAFRRELGAIAGFVFASASDPLKAMDRHLFDRWLAEAERHAGLPKLKGGLWHPYRRKWATERKHLPATDVAAAGGWKDVETLLRCYQAPDRGTLLAVMGEPQKLSGAATVGQ